MSIFSLSGASIEPCASRIEYYPNAHVHHNVQLLDTCGKMLVREYDVIIHGYELSPTVSFLVEAESLPHPHDIGKLLDRATELERWLQAKKVYPASEGTLISARKPLGLNHLFNIQRWSWQEICSIKGA